MTGRYIVDQALANGIAVVASGRLDAPANLPQAVDWRTLDLAVWQETDALSSLIGDVDAILHAAAAVPIRPSDFSFDTLFDAGPRAVAALGRWATQRKVHFVYLSSCMVYRDTLNVRIQETDALQPNGPWQDYGLSKLMSEGILRDLGTIGLSFSILRPTSIYGAGMPPEKIVARWLNLCRQGVPLRLIPPLTDRINMVYAADVAKAALQVAESRSNGTFNVGGPGMVSVREIATACVAAAGCGDVVVIDGGSDADRATARFDVDDSNARRAFGYRPTFDVLRGISDMARRLP